VISDHEDVPGASAADRALRARRFGALLVIAHLTRNSPMLAGIERDRRRVGLTTREIIQAKDQIVRTYQIADRNPDEALAVLREMVEPQGIADSDPADAGVEDYERSDGIPL
jgi:hypothetical protein